VSDADAARRPAAAPPAVARLDGNLAVSRGLGDFAYKADGRLAPGDQKVSCAPEFYGAELRAGDLLILACDGVFDVMSNEGLCRAVAAALDGGADVGDVCARASDASDARRTLSATAVVIVVRTRRPRERRARGDMRADDSRERPNDRDAAAKTSKCEEEDEDDARVVGRGAREDGEVRGRRV